MARPSVHAVIVNWNSSEDTLQCLEHLARCSYPNLRAVVVDNASTDDSLDRIASWCSAKGITNSRHDGVFAVKVIASPVNAGFCRGNNLGIESAFKAGADYALILNNDTLCEPGFLEPLVSVAQSEPRAGLIGGEVLPLAKTRLARQQRNALLRPIRLGASFLRLTRSKQKTASPRKEEVRHPEWLSGCMMLFPRKVYRDVGGFDERFFLWSEDVDLCLRIRSKGYILCQTTDSVIYHKISGTIGKASPLAYYYSSRNSLLLSRKHSDYLQHLLYAFYFFGYCVTRGISLAIAGRGDCAAATYWGLWDYLTSRTGKWRRHDAACAARSRLPGTGEIC